MAILATNSGDGDNPIMQGYPKAAKRFPWLMGNPGKIQHTVLAELHGIPEDWAVQISEAIERLRAEKDWNAKRARVYARDMKVLLIVNGSRSKRRSMTDSTSRSRFPKPIPAPSCRGLDALTSGYSNRYSVLSN
jgi:hypothetical protein